MAEKEENQEIAQFLLEMFQIRRNINMINMRPKIATYHFNKSWTNPVTGYRVIGITATVRSQSLTVQFLGLPSYQMSKISKPNLIRCDKKCIIMSKMGPFKKSTIVW